eukprot:RCo021265
MTSDVKEVPATASPSSADGLTAVPVPGTVVPAPAAVFTALFEAATEHYRKGEYNKAVELFHAADRAQVGNSGVVTMLANCYGHMGKMQASLDIYKYATDLNPHCTEAWFNRGQNLMLMGRHAEAKECLANALRDTILTGSIDYSMVAMALASALQKLHDRPAACRVLESVMARCQGRHSCAVLLSDLYAEDGRVGVAYDTLLRNQLQDIRTGYAENQTEYALTVHHRMSRLLPRLYPLTNFSIPKDPVVYQRHQAALRDALAQIRRQKA